MSKNGMTTKETWQKHWSERKYIQYVSENYSFHDVILRTSEKVASGGSCIELGGFPGYFSIFLKKYCGLHPTLIDFYFNEKIFKEIVNFNAIHESEICCIKEDIFKHSPTKFYDLVVSFGLVEHFTDLGEVFSAHIKYMKPGAILLITLPNFRGINGLLQKYFDPQNLAIHNLEIMNLRLLKDRLADLGLLEIEVSYYPSTQVWLENLAYRGLVVNLIVRVLTKAMALAGFLFGNENKIISNSIIVTARSPE
jgi:SAM-dependent methyltransferase